MRQNRLKDISDIKADGQNVIFTLASGNADLPYLLGGYNLLMQPGGGVENPNAGIGTGAYKVVSIEPGVRYVFAKNADYWDPTLGHYDQVEMYIINDSTARNAALQSGQVQMIQSSRTKSGETAFTLPGYSRKKFLRTSAL